MGADKMGLSDISIHAPRMGSDARVIAWLAGETWISIHAPRMGSDLYPLCRYGAGH